MADQMSLDGLARELTGREFLAFTVEGQARPAGSKRAIPVPNRMWNKAMPPITRFLHTNDGRPIVNLVDAADSKPWRKRIVAAAEAGLPSGWEEQPHFRAALWMRMRFVKARPAGHYRTGKNSHLLAAKAPVVPTVRPDLLKLARCVEDAMTGVVYHDDSQIVQELLTQEYGAPERVEITVGIWEAADVGLDAQAG